VVEDLSFVMGNPGGHCGGPSWKSAVHDEKVLSKKKRRFIKGSILRVFVVGI
jgi:hypothetical protein